jgi:nucleoporin NDC1
MERDLFFSFLANAKMGGGGGGNKNPNRPYERAQLNERALYLRSTFYILALMQSLAHLAYDYDGIRAIPVPKTYLEEEEAGAAARQAAAPSPMRELRAALPRRLRAAVARCLAMTVAGPIIYGLFLRRRVWRWTLFAVKGVLRLTRPSPVPPGTLPFSVSLFVRSFVAWLLLSFIWETVAVAFEAYFAQEPTAKGGAPLTETCRDANGTLLTGLASKRDVVKVYEFPFLFHICYSVHIPLYGGVFFFFVNPGKNY